MAIFVLFVLLSMFLVFHKIFQKYDHNYYIIHVTSNAFVLGKIGVLNWPIRWPFIVGICVCVRWTQWRDCQPLVSWWTGLPIVSSCFSVYVIEELVILLSQVDFLYCNYNTYWIVIFSHYLILSMKHMMMETLGVLVSFLMLLYYLS